MNTTDNNIENLNELESLRSQVAQFKARLDRQQIVNDRLLRDVVKGKVKSLRKYSATIYILAAIGYAVIFSAFIVARVTLVPVIILGVMCLAEFIFCSWNLRQISHVSQMSVIDAQSAIARYTKREKWLNVGEIIPTLAVSVWAVFEYRPDLSALGEILFVAIVTCIACIVIIGRQFKIIGNIQKSISALKEENIG